jgi:hypothetical protein
VVVDFAACLLFIKILYVRPGIHEIVADIPIWLLFYYCNDITALSIYSVDANLPLSARLFD